MGYEVELKFRLADRDRLIRELAARGARECASLAQEDVYLNHPCRDFAETHEALRIRRTGNENRVTYKGPRKDGPTKTREEIEIRFADGDVAFEQLAQLLGNLGFRPVATVRKTRRTFEFIQSTYRLEIAIDCAEGLGEFAEIEAQAATEDGLPAAQAAVLAAANELGLTEVEPRTYLRMLMQAQAQDKSPSASEGCRQNGTGSPLTSADPRQSG